VLISVIGVPGIVYACVYSVCLCCGGDENQMQSSVSVLLSSVSVSVSVGLSYCRSLFFVNQFLSLSRRCLLSLSLLRLSVSVWTPLDALNPQEIIIFLKALLTALYLYLSLSLSLYLVLYLSVYLCHVSIIIPIQCATKQKPKNQR